MDSSQYSVSENEGVLAEQIQNKLATNEQQSTDNQMCENNQDEANSSSLEIQQIPQATHLQVSNMYEFNAYSEESTLNCENETSPVNQATQTHNIRELAYTRELFLSGLSALLPVSILMAYLIYTGSMQNQNNTKSQYKGQDDKIADCIGRLNQGGLCVDTCTLNTFESHGICVDSCPQYVEQRKCVEKCSEKNNRIFKNQCVPACPYEDANETPSEQTQYCKNQCYPQFQATDLDGKVTCVKSCKQQSSATLHNLLTYKCVSQCPFETYKNMDACVKQCPIGLFVYAGKCLRKCPPGFIQNINKGECQYQ